MDIYSRQKWIPNFGKVESPSIFNDRKVTRRFGVGKNLSQVCHYLRLHVIFFRKNLPEKFKIICFQTFEK